jgi:hypothetical protein
MVDRKSRIKGAGLIREFLDCRITNDEFDERFPHDSYDPALKNIGQRLWFFWSDLETHRLDQEHQLSSDGKALFERCVAFLHTDLEYVGPTVRVDFLAWLKRGWRRATGFSRTRSSKNELESPWWPFSSEEQFRQHSSAA